MVLTICSRQFGFRPLNRHAVYLGDRLQVSADVITALDFYVVLLPLVDSELIGQLVVDFRPYGDHWAPAWLDAWPDRLADLPKPKTPR